MLTMLQALGARTRPRTQLEGQGWAGVALLHRGRLGVGGTQTISVAQHSLPHTAPLLLPSITSFLLAIALAAPASALL